MVPPTDPSQAEANLVALIESSDDLIWSVDLAYRLLTFNTAFRNNLDSTFSVRAAIGMRPEDWLPPERAVLWRPMYDRALSKGPFRAEYRLFNGRTLELAFNPIRRDGRAVGVSVFGKDITERKTAEKALREAERRYRGIFEGALEGVFRTTHDGRALTANSALAKMLGYDSPEEVISAITDAAHQVWLDPSDRSRCLKLLEEHEAARGYECQFKRKDGTVIWVSVNLRRITAQDNQPGYYEGFVEDITARKRMEETLRKSEEKFAKAFLFSPAIMALADLAEGGRLIDVNGTFEQVTGYRREEAIGRTANELGLWVDPREFEESLKQFQDTGRLCGFERRFLTKTGEVRTGLTSAERLELDGRTCAISATIDITERKEAQARLEAQNARFQGIIENADAGYFRLGVDGCYEEVNPAWLRMHGFTSRDEAIGLHFSAVQVPADLARAEEAVEALMSGASAKSGEFSRLRRDGTIGYHTVSANRVLDGDRVLGIEGFLVDISDRKRAERERHHTEQQYRSLFNSMWEGVAIHKLVYSGGVPDNYILLEVNRRYEEILGTGREDVVNKPATEAYGVQSAPYLKEYASVVETGTPLQFETHFPPMDKHFMISVAPMGEDRFATIFFDITEQKRTEERYKLVSENAADVIWLWDLAEGRCIYISPSVRQLRGFSPEEALGQSMDRAMPPDAARKMAAETQSRIAAVESGDETARIRTNEVEYLRKDGTAVPTETITKLLSDERGRVSHVVGVTRDLAQRKEAEKNYRDIFEGALEGIYRTSAEGKCLAANPAMARILGYSSPEDIVSSIGDTAHQVWLDPDERQRCTARLEGEGSVRNFECRFRRRDGTVIWVSNNSRKVCGPDGRTLYYDGFIEDITERKRVEGERLKLEDELRQAQKLESIGRLAGGVAHDFNNLLTVINGYGSFLLKGLKAGDPLRFYAGEISTAGERAASLTKQLLAFSRKQVIEPRVLDLNATVRECAPMLQRLIGEDVTLETRLDGSLGQTMADPDQIHQVIMNLAVNARDSMPDGGSIVIETRNVELNGEGSAAVHPEARPGHYVLMSVTDTGQGMDETIRRQIFDPFFTTKEVGKGTGLGLSTVYGIVRQSNGWIDVLSEVGVGTTFRIYLPRLGAGSVREETEVRPQAEGGSETILVVEDQDSVRFFTTDALNRHGYRVLESSNGDEAIAVARRHPGRLDMLLTDVVLPGMNGKELSERLRKTRPDLKVLFISGYTADVIADHGVLDRGVEFLRKPFSPEELAAKVRDVLADPSAPIAGG
ncbi:MAG TPA: PAS domain S-box protein [Bryobacteraceae bacterium]|nr:PAS domain S-box protein [Bryobacteraceae bacterium]